MFQRARSEEIELGLAEMGVEHFGQLGLRKNTYALVNRAGFESKIAAMGAVLCRPFDPSTPTNRKGPLPCSNGPIGRN